MRRNSGGCCPVLALALALALTPVRGDDARISSAEIMTAALDIACVDYRIVGGCLWMTCTPLGCEFDFSIRAAHRIPEAVVTAYPFLGNSSWVESNALVTPTAWAEEGGASDEGGASVREQALKFKLADVIGSPGVIDAWTAAAASTTALPFCTPLTYPMTPYFISTLDPAWRDPIVETPLTLAHALDRVGKGAATFAGLYPRIGFVNQGHDYKSALTAAIRAMDIVRRDYQPHVYVPLAAYSAGGQGQWPPGPDDPVRYQQLTPTLRACTELPDIDDTLYLTDPYAGRLNQVTGNAWQVWRDYACCEPAGATLLYHF